MNKTYNCSPCNCDKPSPMKSEEERQHDVVYYFLLGYDFKDMLMACDGSPGSIDEIVEEALKYNTGEKPLEGVSPNFKFEVQPERFREAVVWALNSYWGYKIPVTTSCCC